METDQARVASKYAEATIDLALQAGAADLILADLEAINKVIAQAPGFQIVLSHPSINSAEKKSLLVNLFSKDAQDLTIRLLNLLTDKRRVKLLPYIEQEYRSLLKARKNIVSASLETAEPLDDKVVNEIKEKLKKSIGKDLELKVEVDRSLIGGLMLKIGDQVIDGSLKGKLKKMERELLSV